MEWKNTIPKIVLLLLRITKVISRLILECRLINLAKTQIGRVSKIIVQDICASLRLALNINQWQSTKDCIKWFEEYDKDNRCSFIKYDIREFYPSITKRAFDRALDLAKEYMVIPLEKVEIIKHCRKTLLYYEDSIWIKEKVGTSTRQ